MSYYPLIQRPNMYPSPAYQPPMLPPPAMAQPYAPTPPMGMAPFASSVTPFASSVDPLMMQRGLGPPFAPGGTPLDMIPPPPPMGPPPPPPYMPGFMPQQLSCWRDCMACLAVALCWCFVWDECEPSEEYL